MIKYLYGQNIKIGSNNVKEILTTADYFQIGSLKSICEYRMCHSLLNYTNCLEYYHFALDRDLEQLCDKAWKLSVDQPKKVCKTVQFKKLTVNQLIRFLSADDICIDREETICSMVENWVKYDSKNRKQFIETIFKSGAVRMGLLSTQYLFGELEEFFTLHDQCHWSDSLIKQATKYKILSSEKKSQLSLHKRLKIDPKLIRPRFHCGNVPTLVIVGGINESSRITRVMALQKSLQAENDENLNHSRFSNTSQSDMVQPYNTAPYKWHALPDITTEHKNAHSYLVNTLDNNIYITGGHHSSGCTMSYVSMFHTHLNKWLEVAELNEARERHSGTTLDDDLYVAGGLLTASKIPPNAINPKPAGTNLSKLAINRDNIPQDGRAALRDFINAHPMQNNNPVNAILPSDNPQNKERPTVLDSIERYSPKTTGDQWKKITELPHKCYSPGMAGYKMKLYIVGGVGLGETSSKIQKLVLDKVQIYDTTNNQWTISILKEPLARLSCAVNQENIYLLANNNKKIYKFDMDKLKLDDFSIMPNIKDFADTNGVEFASFNVFDNKLTICGGQVSTSKMTKQINFISLDNGKILPNGNSFNSETCLPKPICMHGAVTIMYKRLENLEHVEIKNEHMSIKRESLDGGMAGDHLQNYSLGHAGHNIGYMPRLTTGADQNQGSSSNFTTQQVVQETSIPRSSTNNLQEIYERVTQIHTPVKNCEQGSSSRNKSSKNNDYSHPWDRIE